MCTKQKNPMGNDIAEKKNSREMYTEKRAFNNIQKVLFNTKKIYIH